MVWFQCEACGENLKKPKLANHFRMCSAYKLSCIDCGQTFSQETVQGHTQCISEAEKYGPKDQGKPLHNGQAKSSKPKPNSEVDVKVGLSSWPPWFCSLCNTSATSQQTLLLHADGKKHRAKARAFHAAQKQTARDVPNMNGEAATIAIPEGKLAESNGFNKTDTVEDGDPLKDTADLKTEGEKESPKKSKRKHDASSVLAIKSEKIIGDSKVDIIQADQLEEPQHKPKKKKNSQGEGYTGKQYSKEASLDKIKWKKLVTSILKSDPDGVMKTKKLQKLVIKSLRQSGVTEDESQLRTLLMDKISSSSRFLVDEKTTRFSSKVEGS